MGRPPVILVLLFAGMASPYLVIMYLTRYHNVVLLLLQSIRDFQLHSISAFMALAAIAAYVYRLRSGSGSRQDSLIIATLTVPVVLPSLLMVGLLVSPVGEDLPIYFSAAADLYLAGIASLAIVLPMLAVVSHANSIILLRGTPAGAILMTMVTYGIATFVMAAALAPVQPEATRGILEQIGTRVLLDALFVGRLIVANVMDLPLPVPPESFATSLQLGLERIYTGALFALSSAIFLYYRLYRRHSEQDLSLDQSRSRETILSTLKLTPMGFAIIAAALLDFGFVLGISQLTNSAELGLQVGLLGLMLLLILVGAGDSIAARLFRRRWS